MTMEFECLYCGKRFYIHGIAEVLFNEFHTAALKLRSIGYKSAGIPVWKIVEDRAKCCERPNIFCVAWECGV